MKRVTSRIKPSNTTPAAIRTGSPRRLPGPLHRRVAAGLSHGSAYPSWNAPAFVVRALTASGAASRVCWRCRRRIRHVPPSRLRASLPLLVPPRAVAARCFDLPGRGLLPILVGAVSRLAQNPIGDTTAAPPDASSPAPLRSSHCERQPDSALRRVRLPHAHVRLSREQRRRSRERLCVALAALACLLADRCTLDLHRAGGLRCFGRAGRRLIVGARRAPRWLVLSRCMGHSLPWRRPSTRRFRQFTNLGERTY